MKKDDLMAGIGEIDEKIVDETGEKRAAVRGRRKMKVLFSVIAAVLVLSILGTAVLVMNVNKPAPETHDETEPVPGETKVTLTVEFSDDFFPEDAEGLGRSEADFPTPSAMPSEKSDSASEVGAKDGASGESFASDPAAPVEPGEGELPKVSISDPGAFVLTAAEWRDLDNWSFFVNLINSGLIDFPAYGVDPRCRVCVTVTAADGSPLEGEKVTLLAEDGSVLFSAVSGKDGKAYLFWGEGETPAAVLSGDAKSDVTVRGDTSGEQGGNLAAVAEDATLVKTAEAPVKVSLQVSFIIDTTGSMGDELAYLQKDFASIAEEAGVDGVTYSVNFYRDEGDEYVTKCNPFTNDIETVKSLLNDEYCTGGGDTPEAVDQILKAAITDNTDWADDCEKIAFLIFDAPPHAGTEDTINEAIRSAAERGIRLIPVVASNSERDTELFGRAIAAVTGGTYVFLTDDSGVGESHLEPIVGDYEVELLHDVIVRIINEYKVG